MIRPGDAGGYTAGGGDVNPFRESVAGPYVLRLAVRGCDDKGGCIQFKLTTTPHFFFFCLDKRKTSLVS